MASIVLLQNDPVVAQGLRKALAAEPGLQVTGLAGTLAQARQLLRRGGVELLVADLRVGGERLVELLRERAGQGMEGRPHVLAVAMSADDPHLMQALRHGAQGYFIHGQAMEALVRVVQQVLAGESPMSATIARRLKAHFKPPGRPGVGGSGHSPGLTAVEREMLNRVSQGYLVHEIAREMHTSEHSVGLRTRALYRKLQLDLRMTAWLKHAA